MSFTPGLVLWFTSVVHYGPEPPELVAQAEEMSKQQDREFRRLGRHRTWAECPSFRMRAHSHWLRRRQGSLTGLNAVVSVWHLVLPSSLVATSCARSPSSCFLRPSGKSDAIVGVRQDWSRWYANTGMVPVQCSLASGCVCPWLGPVCALHALVGEWTAAKPLVVSLGLSAGFKGHFTAQDAFDEMCDACHRNAPRWVPSVA